MTQYFIKELDSLAKTTKDIAILQLAQKQPLFGFPNKPAQLFNSQKMNIHNIENKLTRFRIYPETELACKYNKPLYKTQYSEILVKYKNGFDMNVSKLIMHRMATSHSYTDENSYVSVKFQKNAGRTGGKFKPQDTESTRLQELSLMNNTFVVQSIMTYA